MPRKCFRGLQDHCGDYEDLAKPPAPPSAPTSIPPLTSGSVLSADSALSSTGLQDSFVTTHIIDQTAELQLEAAATAKRGYLGSFPTTLLVGMFFSHRFFSPWMLNKGSAGDAKASDVFA